MDIAEQLRDALAKSGLSTYAVGMESGVSPGQISRFVAGERDLTLSTAARLAAVLGLELVPQKPKRSPKKPQRRKP